MAQSGCAFGTSAKCRFWTTGIIELIVVGFFANVCIGIVSLLRLSSLAKRVPNPVAFGTDPRSLVVRKGEFLDDDLGVITPKVFL